MIDSWLVTLCGSTFTKEEIEKAIKFIAARHDGKAPLDEKILEKIGNNYLNMKTNECDH